MDSTDTWRPLEIFGRFLEDDQTGVGQPAGKPTPIHVDPRDEYKMPKADVTVVFKQNGDVIFQIFPKVNYWPSPKSARVFLTELVKAHFGQIDNFQAEWIPLLHSWALKAEGLQNWDSFDRIYHTQRFVTLLNDTLAEMELTQ